MKVVLTVFLVFLTVTVQSQQLKGTLAGSVTGADGLPLSFAAISANQGGGSTSTDEKGNYLLKLPAGNYVLTVKLAGYAEEMRSIAISAGKITLVPIVLTAAAQLLEQVNVTGVRAKTAAATRTLMQVLDVPQAVSVVGQRVIRQQAAYDLSTITRNISGVNFTGNYSGAGSSQFFNARGFDLNETQNYRWNGVMLWNLGNNYADNIEQVEFLKGPSSILFGDVAPGGVMNLVTKKPQPDFSARAELKTGSWGLIRPALDITGPLNSSKTVRFRLNSSFERSDSFRDKVSSQAEFVAPALTWDLTPKFSLYMEAGFRHSRATDDAGLVSPDGTTSGLSRLSSSLYLGEPARNYTYADQRYYTTLTYQLDRIWRLKATGFYAETVDRPFGIWFDQPDANGDFARREYGYYQRAKNASASAEITGTFYTGSVKHTVLAGAEYQSARNRLTNAGALSLLDTNNIYNPVYNRRPTVEPATSPFYPYVSIIGRSGLFVQDQLLLYREKLYLLLGLRAGRTRQGNDYYENELPGTPYEGYSDNIISKNVFTPRVGLVYKRNAYTSLYASWSTGYELNSPDIFARNYEQYATPPSTNSTQFELGAKADLPGNKLGATFALFEINKHHPYGYVYLDPVNPVYDQYNIYYEGHHRSRGAELEIDGRILQTLSLTAGAAYTRTRVMDDPGYPDGNVLPNAPRAAANCWLHYTPLKKLRGFSASAGLFYKSSFFSGIANDARLKLPAVTTVDAAIGYSGKRIGIQANVMNLTNRVSYLNPWQFNLFDVRPLRQTVLTFSYQVTAKK